MRTWMFLLNTIFLSVVLPLVLSIFQAAGYIIIGEVLWGQEPWLAQVAGFGPLLALLIIYVFATLEPAQTYGVAWSKDLLWLSIGAGVIAGPVIYFTNILFDVFFSVDVFGQFSIPQDPSLSVAAGFLFSLAVLVPITEELLFRGLIQTSFTQRINNTWRVHPAIWIAVGLEVLAHASGAVLFAAEGEALSALFTRLPQLLYVFVFGAIGGWVYHRTKSLTGPILIHALGNAGELALYWLAAA